MAEAASKNGKGGGTVSANATSTGARERYKSMQDLYNQASRMRATLQEERVNAAAEMNRASRNLEKNGHSDKEALARNAAVDRLVRVQQRNNYITRVMDDYMTNIGRTTQGRTDQERTTKEANRVKMTKKSPFALLGDKRYIQARLTQTERKYTRAQRQGK